MVSLDFGRFEDENTNDGRTRVFSDMTFSDKEYKYFLFFFITTQRRNVLQDKSTQNVNDIVSGNCFFF